MLPETGLLPLFPLALNDPFTGSRELTVQARLDFKAAATAVLMRTSPFHR